MFRPCRAAAVQGWLNSSGKFEGYIAGEARTFVQSGTGKKYTCIKVIKK